MQMFLEGRDAGNEETLSLEAVNKLEHVWIVRDNKKLCIV